MLLWASAKWLFLHQVHLSARNMLHARELGAGSHARRWDEEDVGFGLG